MKVLLEIGFSRKVNTNYIMKRGYIEVDLSSLKESETVISLHEAIKNQLIFIESCNTVVDLTNKKYIKSRVEKNELTDSDFWGWKMIPISSLNEI